MQDDFERSNLVVCSAGSGHGPAAGALLVGGLALCKTVRAKTWWWRSRIFRWVADAGVGADRFRDVDFLGRKSRSTSQKVIDIYRSGDYALELRLYF